MQKVFLVEDSPLVLERLIARLRALPNTRIVGHAAGAVESVRSILDIKPDVVVLDLKLAQGTGFDVLMDLQEKAPGIDLYVLSNHFNKTFRRQAERLGARAYFDKTFQFEHLCKVLADRVAGLA